MTFSTCTLAPAGRVVQHRDLGCGAFSHRLSQIPAWIVVALEACSGAHAWARRCLEYGLRPKLIAAQFVKPFRKGQSTKNDRNDAEAAATATAARPGSMRFVPVKSVDQQARLGWRGVREGYKVEGLAISNRLRGILAELGVVTAAGDATLRTALQDQNVVGKLPTMLQPLLSDLYQHWQQVRQRSDTYEMAIAAHAKACVAQTFDGAAATNAPRDRGRYLTDNFSIGSTCSTPERTGNKRSDRPGESLANYLVPSGAAVGPRSIGKAVG